MKAKFTRRTFIAGVGASLPALAHARAPHQSLFPVPRPERTTSVSAAGAGKIIADARLGGASVSYAVADARTGQMLEALTPDLRQLPASVTKVFTSLYGLGRLGPGYRFRTQLVSRGRLSGGKLDGDLILVGGGDPTLTTDVLGDMARDLKAAGIFEVTGDFLVYAGALPYIRSIDNEQPDHVGYNPAISGLNLNFNRVHFEWKRAKGNYEISLDARARRFSPEVTLAKMRIVDRAAPVYTYAEKAGHEEWTVARGALGGGGARWLPVRDPARYAGEVFSILARSHGIILKPAKKMNSTPQGKVIVEATSEPLREIMQGMLRYSTNLTAEAIGLTASRSNGNHPRTLAASASEMQSWLSTTYPADSSYFIDHSGLGDAARVSARTMIDTLVESGPDGPLSSILRKYDVKDSKVTLRAKTGTLNFVSALSGFARTKKGRVLAFAIFSADTARRDGLGPAERERPPGGRAWLGRARHMQFELIRRWDDLYSG